MFAKPTNLNNSVMKIFNIISSKLMEDPGTYIPLPVSNPRADVLYCSTAGKAFKVKVLYNQMQQGESSLL